MRNWDSNLNRIFVHMFNTANFAGVAFRDDATGTPVTTILDYFDSANELVANVGVDLGDRSFSNNSSETWTINIPGANLVTLATYINQGNNLAFGFDPDCHFWNNGIAFYTPNYAQQSRSRAHHDGVSGYRVNGCVSTTQTAGKKDLVAFSTTPNNKSARMVCPHSRRLCFPS